MEIISHWEHLYALSLSAEAAEEPSAPHVFLNRSSWTLWDFFSETNFLLSHMIYWSFSDSRKVLLCNNKTPLLFAWALWVKYAVYLVESWRRMKEIFFLVTIVSTCLISHLVEVLWSFYLVTSGFILWDVICFSVTVSNKSLST